MRLRAGTFDVVVGYEAQGSGWRVYIAHDGNAPTSAEQQYFDTRELAHEAWSGVCTTYLESVSAVTHAPPLLPAWSTLFDLTREPV